MRAISICWGLRRNRLALLAKRRVEMVSVRSQLCGLMHARKVRYDCEVSDSADEK